MHLSASRKLSRLPKRFPVGATYVVEGRRGGADGRFRIVSRYVVLPGGERINLGADIAAPATTRTSRRARRRTAGSSGAKARSSRNKKIAAAGGTSRRRRG